MSGHSRWATMKHNKAAADARRGKLLAMLIKIIEVEAQTGGGDPVSSPTLHDAIQKVRKNSVSDDNIDHAIRHGAGLEGGAAGYETVTNEGYAPAGWRFWRSALTDNRNRAVAEVRTASSRNGGSLSDPGWVSYLSHRNRRGDREQGGWRDRG